MAVDPLVVRIEAASRSIWSPDEQAEISGWSLGASGGYTRRLNSATAAGAPETSQEVGAAIAAWFAERSLPTIVRVTPLMDEAVAIGAGAAWGLRRADPTPVMVKAMSGPLPDLGAVDFIDPAAERFVDDLFDLNERDRRFLPQWAGIVSRLANRGVGLWVPGTGVGFVGVQDGVGCVYSIAVDQGHRRSGVATRLMAAAETWAARRGAELMALQVVGTNTAAIALYEHLGYRKAYEYSYLEQR